METLSRTFDVEGHAARLQRDGYTILEDFLDAATLSAVRAGLAPHLGHYTGRNHFEGFETERVYTLVARGKVFEDITMDARVLALLDRFLQPGYLLTASQAISIHPGSRAQPVHFDDGFYQQPRPRPAISLSLICAVDPFTRENGATEIIPASHLWGDDEMARHVVGQTTEAPESPAIEAMLKPVEMPAGACLIFQGNLLHRGGANRTDRPRLAFTNQYCEPWARTQENFFLGVPREIVRAMHPRLQRLLGYEIWPPFMGHVTASHPLKALEDGWRAPVLENRQG